MRKEVQASRYCVHSAGCQPAGVFVMRAPNTVCANKQTQQNQYRGNTAAKDEMSTLYYWPMKGKTRLRGRNCAAF